MCLLKRTPQVDVAWEWGWDHATDIKRKKSSQSLGQAQARSARVDWLVSVVAALLTPAVLSLQAARHPLSTLSSIRACHRDILAKARC